MNKSIIITGANIGIGKEVARQLALLKGTEKIYLACRNESKARAAKKELEELTGKSIFEIIIMDVSNLDSVRAAVSSLKVPIDALIMNAGSNGGKTPTALTKDGVTEIFATNTLGHVVLLEELIKAKKLNKIALYSGSEAARGISKMGIKGPGLQTSSADEFATVINGNYFVGKKFNLTQAYGQAKYVGALWMASIARKNTDIKFITMSPGSTQGTEIANGLPTPVQFILNHILMPFIMPLFGMSHKLETGAKRIVDGINNDFLKSGVFYASKQNVMTGPVIDQSIIFPDLKNEVYQDNANEAIHRFITAGKNL